MKFSEKIGKTKSKAIQIESMDDDLRNSLWNLIRSLILSPLKGSEYKILIKFIWINFYKLTIDSIPSRSKGDEESSYDIVFKKFYAFKWYEVYDFIEFIGNLHLPVDMLNFKDQCNYFLEKENSGYRFIDGKIAPITNTSEIEAIEKALYISERFTALNGANVHLSKSLEKLSDKQNPDYANSIKEAISSVEFIAKKFSDKKNDSLSGSLDKLKRKLNLHQQLANGFKNLYNWTSDAGGIRHSAKEGTLDCDFDDAKFMLVSCSAFVNY